MSSSKYPYCIQLFNKDGKHKTLFGHTEKDIKYIVRHMTMNNSDYSFIRLPFKMQDEHDYKLSLEFLSTLPLETRMIIRGDIQAN
jgi:hypothetical protein